MIFSRKKSIILNTNSGGSIKSTLLLCRPSGPFLLVGWDISRIGRTLRGPSFPAFWPNPPNKGKPIFASTYRFGFKQIENCREPGKKNSRSNSTKAKKKEKKEQRQKNDSPKRVQKNAPIQSFVFPHLGRWAETFFLFRFVRFKLSFSLFFSRNFYFWIGCFSLGWVLFFFCFYEAIININQCHDCCWHNGA